MHDIPKPEPIKKQEEKSTPIRQELKEVNESNAIESKEQKLARLLETREKIAEAKTKPITFSQPILKQNENPVFFPKTINVIQGKAGVHKSRLAETICSALLKRPETKKELLGFRADVLSRFAICYVDTERNLSDQLPYALQQIQLKAGFEIEEKVDSFDCISLLEFDREIRFEMLDIYLEHIRKQYNTHIFIVLDVITDCVFNFNDTKDSMKLIDMMNKSINRFDVTFLCLIHENPGSTDKARGHLGTEIMNKASTVIQVGFEKDSEQAAMDLIKLNYLKCRSSKKHDPVYLQYSDTEKGLILASPDVIREAMDRKRQKADIETLTEQLSALLEEPMPRKQLLTALRKELKCGERILEERLKEIIAGQMPILDSNGNPRYLIKENREKQVFYLLTSSKNSDLPF